MFAGLLSELRIKLRDEQPALSYGLPSELRIKLRDGQPSPLAKSSLLNTSMLNEVKHFHVLGPSTMRRLRRVDELSSAPYGRSSPMRSPTAMRRRRMPSASESGEGGVEIYRTRR